MSGQIQTSDRRRFGMSAPVCGPVQNAKPGHQSVRLRRPDWRNSDKLAPPCAPPSAFTFVELMASITIMLLLTTVALPLATLEIRRSKELELRRDLREMRDAIDHYKDFADRGMIPVKADTFGYPPDLQTLVDGVALKGSIDAKYKFLRKLPMDPMTETTDWGMRSMQDDTDSRSWGGQNVFDVYSKSDALAADGTKYSDW
jgi:general secretion pathway protein G